MSLPESIQTKEFNLYEFNMDKDGNQLGPLPFTYELSTDVFPEYHTFEEDNKEEWDKYFEPNGATLYRIVKEKLGETKDYLTDADHHANDQRPALDFKFVESLGDGINMMVKNLPVLPVFNYDPILHFWMDPLTAYFEKKGQMFFVDDPCNYCQLYARLHYYQQCWLYDYVVIPVKFIPGTRHKTDAEKLQNTVFAQRELTKREIKEFASLIPDHGETIPHWTSEISPFIYPLVITDYFKVFETSDPDNPYLEYVGPADQINPYYIYDDRGYPYELGHFIMPSYPEAGYEDMNMVNPQEILILEYMDASNVQINPMTGYPRLLTKDIDCSFLNNDNFDLFRYKSFYSTFEDRLIPIFEANNPYAFEYIAPGMQYNYQYNYIDLVATNNQFLFNVKVAASVANRFIYKSTHPYKGKVLQHKVLEEDAYCAPDMGKSVRKSLTDNPILFSLLYPEFLDANRPVFAPSIEQTYLPVPPPQPVNTPPKEEPKEPQPETEPEKPSTGFRVHSVAKASEIHKREREEAKANALLAQQTAQVDEGKKKKKAAKSTRKVCHKHKGLRKKLNSIFSHVF